MSEISDTTVLLQLSGQGTYYLLRGAVKGTLFLLQTYKKMHKEGMLANGEVQNFEKFIQATDGKYNILNIPTENPEEIAKMKEDLNRLKAAYTVLPDLNAGDGQIQIAYAAKDAAKVENWYRSFCLDRLQPGGEKSYKDLMNFTDGQVTIINIPWPRDKTATKDGEGKNAERELEEGLNKEQITHAVLPSIAPEKKSIAVPSFEKERVSAWCQQYQRESGDILIQSAEEYLHSGEMDEYKYVNTMQPDKKEKLNLKETMRPGKQAAAEKAEAVTAVQWAKLPENLKGEEVTLAALPFQKYELTGGNVDGIENIEKLKQDLEHLHVNYTILPDLNVGDGYIQVAFATADTPKVQAWYQAYQQDMLSAGMPMEEIREIQIQDYLDTGKQKSDKKESRPDQTEENYQTGYRTPDGKNRFNNFEQRTYNTDFYNTLENLSNTKSNFLSRDEYLKQKSLPEMMEVSINENLVQSQSGDRMFVSRIPGTQGREYLCVPSDRVYQTDEGKTYGILMKQSDHVTIVDQNGAFLRSVRMDDLRSNYNQVRDGMEFASKTRISAPMPKAMPKPKIG